MKPPEAEHSYVIAGISVYRLTRPSQTAFDNLVKKDKLQTHSRLLGSKIRYRTLKRTSDKYPGVI